MSENTDLAIETGSAKPLESVGAFGQPPEPLPQTLSVADSDAGGILLREVLERMRLIKDLAV